MFEKATYDEFAIERINEQSKEIDKRTEPIPTYSFKKEGKIVVGEPSSKGWVKMLEKPKPNVDYVFGYDGILTSELTSDAKGTSKIALVGMKGVDPQSDLQFAPILVYSERPKSIEIANKKVVDIVSFYNQYGNAKIIGELNAGGEHMIKDLINSGLGN